VLELYGLDSYPESKPASGRNHATSPGSGKNRCGWCPDASL